MRRNRWPDVPEYAVIAIQPSEAEVLWDDFLRSLADRGLRGVKLIIADEHKGLKGAAAKVLGTTIRAAACISCAMRNALACVGKKDRPIVTAALRTAFDLALVVAGKGFNPRQINRG